jgi:hypothetical protein
MKIAAAKKTLQDGSDPPVEGAGGLPELIIPDAQKHLELVFHQVLELVGSRTGAVERRRRSRL